VTRLEIALRSSAGCCDVPRNVEGGSLNTRVVTRAAASGQDREAHLRELGRLAAGDFRERRARLPLQKPHAAGRPGV
jgi:hypothetical protein